MLNLIRRDLILQKKLILTFIPFIGFFIFMDSHPVLIFLVASIFIPFNASAYDEKTEVNILLNSLPYTRKEIIAARYVGALLFMMFSIGLSSLALYALNKPFTLTDVAIGGGSFLVFAALTFPLFYLFKPGHITTVIIFGFVFLTAFTPFILRVLAKHSPAIIEFISNLSNEMLYTGATLLILLIYSISWGFTTVVYQRKAF
jgi:ABC-2 type transport system permease protein